MKKVIQKMMVGAGLAMLMLTSAAAFTPNNIITQTLLPEYPGGPETTMQIESSLDTGEQNAPIATGVGEKGSIFKLYGDIEGVGLVLLDTKWIGRVGLSATIDVATPDPWMGDVTSQTINGRTVTSIKRRTRVDKGYTVSALADGLSSNSSFPQSLKEVQVHWKYLNPTGGQDDVINRFSFKGGTEASPYENFITMDSGILTAGGLSYPAKSGPTNDGFAGEEMKMARQELLTVDTLVDMAIPEATNLARVIVTVWPMTTAQIWQFDTSGNPEPYVDEQTGGQRQTFNGEVRPFLVTWDSIYPGTKVYATISNNSQNSSLLEILPDTNLSNEPMAQNGGMMANGRMEGSGPAISPRTLAAYINRWGNGTYTVKIIHADLPFTDGSASEEVLTEISFIVDREIKIKGGLGTIGSDDN